MMDESPRPPPPPIWTWAEDKLFENSLMDDRPDRWERIAAQLPGKSPEDVAEHYEVLISDLDLINSGVLGFPDYMDSSSLQGRAAPDDAGASDCSKDTPTTVTADAQELAEGCSSRPTKGARKPRCCRYIPKEERKKSVPWTEMEHRLFLRGLQECVKGDWKRISRVWVVTKTPWQVTSHAQKFFKRQNGAGKSKRRSIHDITDPYYEEN